MGTTKYNNLRLLNNKQSKAHLFNYNVSLRNIIKPRVSE